MSLKVIGGVYKGRTLLTPKHSGTRPTQSIVRGALFNIWQHLVTDARFLDLFAGSGAIGIEALSRGARHVTFVEHDLQALRCIRANLEKLEIPSESFLILPHSATAAIRLLTPPFDLIYADPPYTSPIAPFLSLISAHRLLSPGGRLMIEQEKKSAPPPASPFILLEERNYGIARLYEYGNPS
jgi:16S rRNA (guanine(966)-N(2))-methyltransferase RsmD